AEVAVEVLSLGAPLVRGELDEGAAAYPRQADCMLHHRLADATPAQFAPDPHAFDRRPLTALIGEPRRESELKTADHLACEFGDNQHIARIGRDDLESLAIAGWNVRTFCHGQFAMFAERIVGEERQDRGQVRLASLAEDRGRYLGGFKLIHPLPPA